MSLNMNSRNPTHPNKAYKVQSESEIIQDAIGAK
jgi:hypothetical protein